MDLAGRGPLGLKQPKPPKASRKALPRVSKKRAAYLASDDRKAGLATGGGADPTKGTKAQPGPLHQVRSHAWDALAVALAAMRERGLV